MDKILSYDNKMFWVWEARPKSHQMVVRGSIAKYIMDLDMEKDENHWRKIMMEIVNYVPLLPLFYF